MTEKQLINNKEVWIQINPMPAHRKNPNIIPTEYFTAAYFFNEPAANAESAFINDENGEPMLFESPVAALSYTAKKLKEML